MVHGRLDSLNVRLKCVLSLPAHFFVFAKKEHAEVISCILLVFVMKGNSVIALMSGEKEFS